MPDKICPVCKNPVLESDRTCNICGFNLRGMTKEFKPFSIDEDIVQTDIPQKPSNPYKEASLNIVRGPQAGITYKLQGDELSIGRNPQCSIFLNDMTVSRLHATLTKTDEGYVITDENSFNGVWINNKDVTSKLIEPGDFIQIGAFCLLYDTE